MPIVELSGCTLEPLIGYLKALGVLRLIAEQADAGARGCWDGNSFRLASQFDEAGLVEFFLHRYCPIPVVAPWNGGSGFYPGDRRDGLDSILQSQNERFCAYRDTIQAVQSLPEMSRGGMTIGAMLRQAQGLSKNEKDAAFLAEVEAALGDSATLDLTMPEFENTKYPAAAKKLLKKLVTKVKKSGSGTKEEIIRACRNRLPDSAVEWLDAVVVVRTNGELAYPPLLGTGGNEGRLDYTNNFMCRIAELLIGRNQNSAGLLRNALFGEPAEGFENNSAGQYEPGRAGGFNQGIGVENKDVPVNPWGFVLGFEGAVAWGSGVARRQRVNAPRLAVSPFTVSPSSVGYGSAADGDVEAARAEVWMPVWRRAVSYGELRMVLKEGRAELGGKLATNGLQFAEAAASLGVDRGIQGFVRYSLLKRRGDSYVALPAGRFAVKDVKGADLVRDLHPLLDFLKAKKDPPARLASAHRVLERAIYEFLLRDGKPRMQAIVAALGRVEQILEFDHGYARVELNPAWLELADSGVEFRIAAAVASIERMGQVGSWRDNLRHASNQFAWTGSSVWRRMAAVLERRVMDGERYGTDRVPLKSRVEIPAQDACAILDGRADAGLVEDLIFGLSVVRWENHFPWRAPVDDSRISREWALLKHLYMADQKGMKSESGIIKLLCANKVSEACDLAKRRLRISERVPVNVAYANHEDGVRLAAALLVPVIRNRRWAELAMKEREMTATGGNHV